jgi:uridine kinase
MLKRILTAIVFSLLIFGSLFNAHARQKNSDITSDVANMMRYKTVIECLDKLEEEKDAKFLINKVSVDSKNVNSDNYSKVFILEGILIQKTDIAIGEAKVKIFGPFNPDTNLFEYSCTVKD